MRVPIRGCQRRFGFNWAFASGFGRGVEGREISSAIAGMDGHESGAPSISAVGAVSIQVGVCYCPVFVEDSRTVDFTGTRALVQKWSGIESTMKR